MFYVKQSESTADRRRVPILMVDETDGSTPEVGLTLYGLLSKNGNTFAATAGTFAEAGYGQYYYQFDTGEIDTLGWAGIHVTATGARNYDAIIHVTAYDAYSGSFIAPTDVWNADISAFTTAGTAGSQLNTAALGGAGGGITAGDVWSYDIGGDAAETKLSTAAFYAQEASNQTGPDNIRDAVWSPEISTSTGFNDTPPYASGYLIQAGNAATTNTPADVWNYATREITGGTATTVTNAVLVDPTSMTGIAGTVWNTDVSAFLSPSAGYDLTQAASGGAGITAGDVWEYDISGIVTAGTSGSQLNTAASVIGGSLTAADVWDYNGTTAIPSVKETLENIYSNTNSIPSAQTISEYVWNAQLVESSGFSTSPPYASGLMYQAGNAITTVPSDVWNYDISAISGAGLAGTQLNLAAAPGAGGGITAADVWNYQGPTEAASVKETLESANTNASNASSQTGSSAIRDAVWDTDVSYLISPSTGFALYQAASGATTSAEQVWNYDISAISGAGLAGTQLNLAAAPSGAGITAGDVTNAVWDVPTSSYTTSGTFGHNILRSDVAGTAGTVSLWTGGAYSGIFADTYRIDEDYNAAIALKDILTGIGASITGNITGDLSGSVGSVTADVNVSTTSMSGIANTVWSTDISGYTSPSAGFDLANASSGAGITAGDVWNYSGSYAPGTSGDALNTAATDSATAAAGVTSNAPSEVWSYVSRTLTSAAGATAGDIWNYTLTSSGQSADTTLGNADDQATGANTNTNSPTLEANIWGYATRTLTSSSAPTAADIWSYAGGRTITGGIVTSVGDKTGYSLSGTQSFNLTGNITGSLSGSVGSVTGSVGSVVSPVLVATASMSGIAGTVWTYGSRTLTSAATGITAGDVWSYNISGITASGTAGAVLNDASVSGSVVTIVNGPYRLTSIAEGTDGRIDILAESVQTIQLNCLDGFGQPFNVTGYAVVVNVYDVSGALTVTYTPTVDFASSGIVSFDIDTDVTGTTGRYTLVVELTAGAEVVQLGPLEILVRPL